MGSLDLYHSKKGFSVIQDGKKHHIQKCFTDPIIRKITPKQLEAFQQIGYFSLNQMDNGEFFIKAKGRVVGGGVIGASIGAFLGKAAVSVVGHGLIFAVGALTGPAAPYTIVALESCFGAAIETTSMAGAVAGGMALGVATGPV